MVFRKQGRPTFSVWLTLPGFGRVGPWSTGLRNRALADSMEGWLRDVAGSDPAVVRGILAKHYTFREAYVAHKERRLEALKEQAADPPLAEVVNRYRNVVQDRRQLDGLDQLLEAAPRAARFSWLTTPKHIRDLLTDAVQGGLRINSVRRSLYAAVKGVLEYQVGPGKKALIAAEVKFATEDDARAVDVTPEQLQAMLDACDEQMRDVALAAVLLGIDRKPLLALTPAKLDLTGRLVRVPDTKNPTRPRTLALSDAALAMFRRLVAGKGPNETLFALNANQVEKRWQQVKRDTGLDVRFKDLRHLFANAWVDEGGTIAGLGGALGHGKASTSLRYTRRQARTDPEQMNQVAERLGQSRPHLRVKEGGA
jgi:integrase